MERPTHWFLSDGRLHLHHGPIDMIVQAEGPGALAAHKAAIARFETLLDELVAELAALRAPVGAHPRLFQGAVAARMEEAAQAFWPEFVTPMAAVAGAGAEAVVKAMAAVPGVNQAYANNGGDIALYFAGDQVCAPSPKIRGAGCRDGAEPPLLPMQSPMRTMRKSARALPTSEGTHSLSMLCEHSSRPFRIAIVVNPEQPVVLGVLTIDSASPWRGIATSGAKGRSFSLGIADSVTALAETAPLADVAATLIGNATDLPDDLRIERAPACALYPDSDLGARLVTVRVPRLDAQSIMRALDRGEAAARAMLAKGKIGGAVIVLQGVARVVGALPLGAPPKAAAAALTATAFVSENGMMVYA